MYALLFAEPVLDRDVVRVGTREGIFSSPLIRACAQGDRASIRALLIGFWPFVQAFERAIDQRVGHLPLRPLVERFGQSRVKTFFSEAREAVREMKEEEGSHALLWVAGAKELGIDLNADQYPQLSSVENLIQASTSDDPVEFFSWLAGVEYLAEELSAYLCHAPAFISTFPSGRWIWGEAHNAHDHHGPSHLEIDEDLARAYHPSNDSKIVGATMGANIRRCIHLFDKAADQIQETLVQPEKVS
ncbi:hypothetical protein AA0242T_2174 [Acetobacter aceti NRIC 0242]|uniref:Uncharacterized protein n=1 Tax=Acetobacter aceti NBRC 14818 TaxID=887700 RepID=A0AB33IH97_ACEAC|nr:hypothetical protein [Acetobacter aceti]TCS35270.1 hypothetical protein EDC15_10167 [Acetobacter aceti NBRC 14818]BCK75342.1 hypothetical protein EMQ_0948 [Acetobacter aceti NBRC 14818]GAN57368.1 hypothetical protein Abac_017_069 [Acetobacter aceti NBRC 14818]GBO81472.1 hypothetical protein AA0242T_2174 [Acetobacter aceti NRIC 0242]